MHSILTTSDAANPARPGLAGRVFALGLWLLGLICWVGWLVYEQPVRAYLHPQAESSLALDALLTFLDWQGLTTLGLVIILHAANRRFGWLILTAGFFFNLNLFTGNYSLYALLVAPQAELPLALLAAWVQDQWLVPIFLFLCLPVLFPDGKLPSRRWRVIFWPTMGAWSLFILMFAFTRHPLSNVFLDVEGTPSNPFGILPGSATLNIIIFVVLLAISIVTGIASVIFRWRRASSEVRQQIKWVLYGFLLVLVILATSWADGLLRNVAGIDLGLGNSIDVAMYLSLFGVLVALGFAVLKYRLYDIDLIINRTLVYGGLTVAIVLGYVLIVSGLGALLPGAVGLLPSIIATAVLAILFAPLRDRLQRWANRLVFGERQHPYEVMRTLGAHLETTTGPEHVLPAIAETIAKSLKFPYVSMTLKRANDFALSAEFGTQRKNTVDLPLYHQANVIGYLSVCLREGEREMARQDRELLGQIALWLGPVAQASLLTQELRQSHARLVSTRAEERRRLYRDLHDGLGPALASQTFRFDHALELLPDDPQAATKILCDLKEQTQGLVLEIRRLVYALRSSVLDELGLVGSLREAVESFRGTANGLRISLVGDEQALRQLPAAHEQAAERIALEALTNAVRHANADRCRLVLEIQEGPPKLLKMTIEDNGRGLQPGYSPGVGIASMIERAEALGGTVRFKPNRPKGTQVVANLPFSSPHQLSVDK